MSKANRKGKRIWWGLLLAVFLLVCPVSAVYAEEGGNPSVEGSLAEAPAAPTPAPKRGLVKEGKNYRYYLKKGALLKNRWKKIGSSWYYFKANGNAAVGSIKIKGQYYVFDAKGRRAAPKRNAVVKVNGRKYYVTPSGNPIPGWNIMKGKLYYVYKNGRCAANTKKDGIVFSKEGYAKDTTEADLKIKVSSIISKITTPNMTKAQKLAACWDWCNSFRFVPWKYPDFKKKNWTRAAALDMINTRDGNCYGLASTFAAFAKELGYTPVLADGSGHCWTEINGIAYDGMFPNAPVAVSAHPRRHLVLWRKKY